MSSFLLAIFAGLKLLAALLESGLSWLNGRFSRDPDRLTRAGQLLHISRANLDRSRSYSLDRTRFGIVRTLASTLALVLFVGLGGLGTLERWAQAVVTGPIGTGLVFFALVGLASSVLSLPFALYASFVIEQRHGFNRQTPAGFALDLLKAAVVTVIVGGPLLVVLLWLMDRAGHYWWLWAWASVSTFSVLTAWLYPRVLAPLFNRFSPLPEGELRDRILSLASATGFRTGGIWVMDASRRSTHGNAYFTGLFGNKRVVLFDTLLEALQACQVVAVLAHELGHFKLGHIRRQLLLSVAWTGVVLFTLSRVRELRPLYEAFHLAEPTAYGALVAFGLWWGLVELVTQPVWHALSRHSERAADAFAARYVPARDLGDALLKLRERSHVLPVSHPWYSLVYHSHPPLIERLERLEDAGHLDSADTPGPI